VVPQSLTRLNFGDGFDQQLDVGVLPQSLTQLSFGKAFKQSLIPESIPQSLTRLSFQCRHSQFNPRILFDGVRKYHKHYIRADNNTNVWFPGTLTHLVLSDSFNQPLSRDTLPPNLTHLALGAVYNRPITADCLPTSVQQLFVPIDCKANVSDVEIIVRKQRDCMKAPIWVEGHVSGEDDDLHWYRYLL
jgi:hypothetical protein